MDLNRSTKPDLTTSPLLLVRCCYVPFLFAQKHRTLLITIFSVLMLLYVNLGLPYRVKYREERYFYIYWFA
jgi:hypothetical protein